MKPDQERPEEYKMRLEIALKAAKICVFEVDIPRQAYIYFFQRMGYFHVSDEKNTEGCFRICVLESGGLSKGDF